MLAGLQIILIRGGWGRGSIFENDDYDNYHNEADDIMIQLSYDCNDLPCCAAIQALAGLIVEDRVRPQPAPQLRITWKTIRGLRNLYFEENCLIFYFETNS